MSSCWLHHVVVLIHSCHDNRRWLLALIANMAGARPRQQWMSEELLDCLTHEHRISLRSMLTSGPTRAAFIERIELLRLCICQDTDHIVGNRRLLTPPVLILHFLLPFLLLLLSLSPPPPPPAPFSSPSLFFLLRSSSFSPSSSSLFFSSSTCFDDDDGCWYQTLFTSAETPHGHCGST